MTGIVGGERSGQSLSDAVQTLTTEAVTESWEHEDDAFGLGVVYPGDDPAGTTTWADDARAAVVYGAITNLDELGWSDSELFDRLFERPPETAAAIEGSFAIAAFDSAADRHLLVTDKLGARPLFFTDDGPVHYASSLATLLPVLDEPSLDHQGVSDMLLIGSMWGDHTLLEEVRALYPATVLTVENGDRTVQRYWKPEYTEHPPTEGYLGELEQRYRQATRRTSRTLPKEAGIWLSGGLDSRTTAAAMVDNLPTHPFEKFVAYTYDANPPTNDNPKLAGRVTRELDIEHRIVPLTAEIIGDNFERLIEATDGMVRWNSTALIGATFGTTPSPVMMEGMQGALLGDHLYRHHLSEYASAVESQLSSEASTDPDTVTTLLEVDVDPVESLVEEATRSPETTVRETVMDTHFQNYYGRYALAGNRIMRECGSSRVVHADGAYLEWCAQLPRSLRKDALGGHGPSDVGVPLEPSPAKLKLLRRINPALANVPYERTKVRPSRPHPVHVAGFVGNVVANRLLSNPTYGNGSLADIWIRDTDTPVHDRVSALVDDACSRDLFNAEAVRELYEAHMAGENNAALLAQITTLEHWIGTYLD